MTWMIDTFGVSNCPRI